jgi:predicted GIY-YIG superfamily endonuclease
MCKIRGSLADLIHHEDFLHMKENGLISSVEQLRDILQDALSFLTHRCHERCQVPKIDENGGEYFICKAPDNYYRTYTPQAHTIETLPVNHSLEANQILQGLGMIESGNSHPIEAALRMERHIPRCSKQCPKFSATNGHLFVCYPSSQNLQLCTGHSITTYLVKYIAGLDDVAIVVLKPQQKHDPGVAHATYESLGNTKITSNKIRANSKKETIGTHGRALTQMECLTVIEGSDLVTSTEAFIHVPTSPREYRPAVFSKHVHSGMRIQDEVAILAVTGQTVRTQEIRHYPQYRLFSNDQMTVIRDELQAPLSTDAVTIFSIRPPELLFVQEIRLYLRWFVRIHVVPVFDPVKSLAYLKKNLDVDLIKCQWLDGLNCKILLRRGAIDEFLKYAQDCQPSTFGGAGAKNKMVRLLLLIHRLHGIFDLGVSVHRSRTTETSRNQYQFLCKTFLSPLTSLKLPTVWWTPVYPKTRGRFLVQILLLFGKFETEYGLMKAGSLRKAYVQAGLFDPDDAKRSLDALMSRYIRKCLAIQPRSTFQFDKSLCLAHSLFSELLLQDSVARPISETPSVLHSKMVADTTEEVVEFKNCTMKTFIDILYNDLIHCGFDANMMPPSQSVYESFASPDVIVQQQLHDSDFYPPPYVQTSRQSWESYKEQHEVMQHAKVSINDYQRGARHQNLVICGGPGNGKTTVSQVIALYALSQGLLGIPTSVVADRSKQLGGIHIHSLCSLTANEGRTKSPGQAAEAAIASLYKKPKLMYLWQKLDFLYIDEFGTLSAEMLATIDIIARHVKRSGQFMGGMFCVATMDILQLLPFRGTPLLLSMNMITEFQFRELNESVRAANDPNLREICNLTRTAAWTPALEQRFKQLLVSNCNFVSDFEDSRIPNDCVFVFGRKAPCQKAEEVLLRKLRDSPDTKVVMSPSFDEESTTAGNWKQASSPVQALICRKFKRKKQLPLFERGRYEFTYNLQGKFQQGQLGMLLSVDEDAIRNRKPIAIFRAPPGCKDFPLLEQCTAAYLLSCGWMKVTIPFGTSQATKIFGKIMGRRTQYGIRLRVASTIHASMGCTLGKLVTAVTNNPSYPKLDFTLWEAAQVVVLISRTRACVDIYFIGEPGAVAEALLSALKTTNRFLPHIRALLSNLCNEHNETPIINPPPIFRPCDIVLPKVSGVYLLVSTVDTNYMYIGETDNIRKRLDQHNAGSGTRYTNIRRLQPWAMMGFVYGFTTRSERRSFEQRWKIRTLGQSNRARAATADGMLSLGHTLASEMNANRHCKLRIEQCGNVSV